MIKHIKTENDLHTFEIYENGILKEVATVGATTQKEAQSILENRPAPNPVNDLKSQLLNEVKSKAKDLLSATDYKVIRHRDQLELNVETTLTDAEYDALLTERNEIRKNSNKFEAEILSKRSLNTLQSYEYKY